MSKSLTQMQLGLHFFITGLSLSSDNDDQYAMAKKAYDLMDDDVSSVPGWVQYLDNHGNLVTSDTGTTHCPYSLCEFDFSVAPFEGRPAFSFWFHSQSGVPPEVAKALRDFCLAKLRLVAEGLAVEYVGASAYREWTVAEREVWPLDDDVSDKTAG